MNGQLAITKIAAAGVVAIAFCVSASAADLSRPVYTKAPAPLPLVEPLYNWTGFYVGANFGGTFSNETVTGASGMGFSTDPSGVLGGVQLGYNYQFSPTMLVGIEGELDWTSAQGTGNLGTVSLTSNHNWYDTVDARVGYVMGPWLYYIKGGAAWMNADYMASTVLGSSSINTTRVGWNIGVGAEYMIAPQWSAKLEYNYLDFGSDSYNFAIPVGGGTQINTQVHEFKVGVNYHFPAGTLFGRW